MSNSQTSFIIASATGSTSIAPSSPLHLLPFSLGSLSNPYKTSTASTSRYFQPRLSPVGYPGLATGTPIASFRGRALVGQQIEVPAGYKGVILSTTARPDHGGLEERRAAQPITPAPSISSSSIATEDGARATRARTRGAGQVALSRPKTRLVPKSATAAGKKRKVYRLDSDTEADEDEFDPSDRPNKRARADNSVPVPQIKVQAPTPRKTRSTKPEPDQIDTSADDADNDETVGPKDEQVAEEDVAQESKVEIATDESLASLDIPTKEEIIPSPETEQDPPTFPTAQIDESTSPGLNQPEDPLPPAATSDERQHDGVIRVLRPTATFDSITIWTPDAPLVGFRADELQSADDSEERPAQPVDATVKTASETIKRSWRQGGAGEGGDDFVRANGEFVGYLDFIHSQAYTQHQLDFQRAIIARSGSVKGDAGSIQEDAEGHWVDA